jgi:hypothetical protein
MMPNMNRQLSIPHFQQQDLASQLSQTIASSLCYETERLHGQCIAFKDQTMKRGFTLWGNSPPSEGLPITNQTIRKKVTAVDSSTCLIGETEFGTLYGARLAIVTREGENLICSSTGSIMVLVTEDLVRCHVDQRNHFLVGRIVTDVDMGGRFIRSVLEKTGLRMALERSTQSILLYDGALSLLQNLAPLGSTQDYLSNSEAGGNMLLGVCKSTALKVVAEAQESLYLKCGFPCYSVVGSLYDDQILLTVAKLAKNALPLRIDIPGSISPSEVLGELLYNDKMHEGYPETLYLAHHMAVFNRLDISALRHRAISRFKMMERRTMNPRRIFLS